MLRFFILNKLDENKIATKEEVVKTWQIMGSIIFEREKRTWRKIRNIQHFHEALDEKRGERIIGRCSSVVAQDNKPNSAHSYHSSTAIQHSKAEICYNM